MKKINILVVDDHELFLHGLSASLETYDFISSVQTFTEVKSAVSFLQKEHVDLIITDISMPEINGIEFIKLIRKTQPSQKILAISMFPPVHNERNFYNGYLLKDSKMDVVIKAVKTIVYDNGTFFYDKLPNVSEFTFTKNIVTKREKEIIQLIVQELTVDEIAEHLFLSKYTIETHKKNIFLKLQVKTNAGLVKKAIQLGYVS